MKKKKYFCIFAFLILLSTINIACSSSKTKETVQKLSSAETVFEVLLPSALSDGEEIFLEIIDEVTGIALNPMRYGMQKKDNQSVYARLSLINGSFVKYRYILRSGGVDTIEYDSSGYQIQYRAYHAQRPTVISDVITSWSNQRADKPIGEISGYVFDNKTNAPLADIFIFLNGNNAITSADGYFEMNHLPVGEYLITAFHPDGIYHPFQQGAVIAENALTPASFGMDVAKTVEITFELTIPENTVSGAPVRLIGNTYSTGNMYGELSGGTSIISSRAPVMTFTNENMHHLTLNLPEGIDFRYKYSLGDGFINAEHSESGGFVSRQLIIPKKDTKIVNLVNRWSQDESQEPVTFLVSVPDNTPSNDVVSIQFNPFVWMQPISMWKTGTNTWTFTLFGPFKYLEKSQFRFCRNDLCGYADDEMTAGENASGFILDLSSLNKSNTITYQLENWVGLSSYEYVIDRDGYEIARPDFTKGIAISSVYNPHWISHFQWGLIDAAISGANSIVITPSWVFSNSEGPIAEYQPSISYSMAELNELHSYAKDAGLSLQFFPQPKFKEASRGDYWLNAPLTYNWWLDWFNSYSRFVKNYALFAEILNTEELIIGGSSISPALPGGKLPNGDPANTPFDISDRWKELISEIKDVYSGDIIFALDDNIEASEKLSFLLDVDLILIEANAPLSASNNPEVAELSHRAAIYLDGAIFEIYQKFNKPIMIGIKYIALDGSASDCVNYDGTCKELLSNSSSTNISIDMQEHADIYSGIMAEAVKRDWINGIISFGYQPSVVVQDASASIRGKPAFDVITYYFNEVIK